MVGFYSQTFEQAKKQGFPKSPYPIEGRCVLRCNLYISISVFFFLIACDHTLTFTNCGGSCYTFGTIGKCLVRQCARWSFHNFFTNGTKSIEFKTIFSIKINQFFQPIFNVFSSYWSLCLPFHIPNFNTFSGSNI